MPPHGENSLTTFGHNVRFHPNYPTFLLLLYRELQLCWGIKRFVPRFVFRILGSRPVHKIAKLLPESFYRRLINKMPAIGYRLRLRFKRKEKNVSGCGVRH